MNPSPPPAPPPEALARLLPPDVDPATGRGLRHEAAAVVWQAVVWGRLGRCDLAVAHLDRVRLPQLGPWIAAERGRMWRELGRHADAEAIEWPALLAAVDPVDVAMLRLSLTANAVGLGDLARAERRLAAATEAVDALQDAPRAARQRIRATWVRAEVALLGGRDLAEVRATLPSWDRATDTPRWSADHQHGSDFHRAKSLLFAGVLASDPDDGLALLDAAHRLAPPMLAWAVLAARRDHPGTPAVAREELAARTAAARAAIVPPPSA